MFVGKIDQALVGDALRRSGLHFEVSEHVVVAYLHCLALRAILQGADAAKAIVAIGGAHRKIDETATTDDLSGTLLCRERLVE